MGFLGDLAKSLGKELLDDVVSSAIDALNDEEVNQTNTDSLTYEETKELCFESIKKQINDYNNSNNIVYDENDEGGERFEKLINKWNEIFQKTDLIETPYYSDTPDEYEEIRKFFDSANMDRTISSKKYRLNDGSEISCYFGNNYKYFIHIRLNQIHDLWCDSIQSEFDTYCLKYTSSDGNGCLYFYFHPSKIDKELKTQECNLYLGFKNSRSEIKTYRGISLKLPVVYQEEMDTRELEELIEEAFRGINTYGRTKEIFHALDKLDVYKNLTNYVNKLNDVDLQHCSDDELEILKNVLKYTHIDGEYDENFIKLIDKWNNIFTKISLPSATINSIDENDVITKFFIENSLIILESKEIKKDEHESLKIIYYPDKDDSSTYLTYEDQTRIYSNVTLKVSFNSNNSKIERTVKLFCSYIKKERYEDDKIVLCSATLYAMIHKIEIFYNLCNFMKELDNKTQEYNQQLKRKEEEYELEQKRIREEEYRKEEERIKQEKDKAEKDALSALDNI